MMCAGVVFASEGLVRQAPRMLPAPYKMMVMMLMMMMCSGAVFHRGSAFSVHLSGSVRDRPVYDDDDDDDVDDDDDDDDDDNDDDADDDDPEPVSVSSLLSQSSPAPSS